MSMGLVFVTAPDADYKLINSLLMHIRDWEYEDVNPTTYGNFKLVTFKDPCDLNMPERRLLSHTCILGERAVVYGDNGVEEFGPLDGFNKMRVPWELV